MKSKTKIYHYKNSFYLIIGNRHIYNSLRKLGVLEKKSWKQYGLPPIKKSLMNCFIRGVFDGDGCFYISRVGNLKYLCASFTCNSRKFLKEIKELLEKNNIKSHALFYDRKPDNTGSWQLRIARKGAIRNFVDYLYLYKDKRYFLSRKYQIAKNFYAGKI